MAFAGVHPYLKALSLSVNLLEEIPTEALAILHGLEELNLGFNKITAIRNDSLINLTSLTHLRLFANLLHTIEDGAFNGISSQLKYLELQKNPLLKEIPYFPPAPKIFSIDLEYCSIGNLTRPLVHDNQYMPLTLLRLSNNNIETINPTTFRNMSIITLILGFNQIRELRPGMFDAVYKTKQLQLNSNSIRVIPSGCFRTLYSLQLLALGSNQISEIHAHGFEGLGNLAILLLSNNQLSEIHNFTFLGIKNLQTLSLSHNRIRFITASAFLALSHLQDLDLQWNVLKTLATHMFAPEFFNNGLLDVKDNPLICDCSIVEFIQALARVTAKSSCFSFASNQSFILKSYTRQVCQNESQEPETQTQQSDISTIDHVSPSRLGNNHKWYWRTIIIALSSMMCALVVMLGVRRFIRSARTTSAPQTHAQTPEAVTSEQHAQV